MKTKHKIDDTDPFGDVFDKSDVVNINIEESDPFGDIFSSEDVVNKDSKKSKDKAVNPKSLDYKINPADSQYRRSGGSGKQNITEEDLEQILKTDEGSRLGRGFKDHLQKESAKGLLNNDDLEKILKTDEGDRRQRIFNKEYIGEEDPHESNDMRLQKHYMDFLNFPLIAGTKSGIPHSNLLPSEYLQSRKKKIDIVDEPNIKHKHDKPSSVIINRDESGELESIEFYCKCGERTFLKFDYVDSVLSDNLTEVITAEDESGAVKDEFADENHNVRKESNTSDLNYMSNNSKSSDRKPEDPFSNSEEYKNMSEEEIEKLMFGNLGLDR